MDRRDKADISERVLYAPNVHTGGGLTLLGALIDAWPEVRPLRAFLDIRAIRHLSLPDCVDVTWVAPTMIERFKAELLLRKFSQRESTILLCFHGLPPLFSARGRVLVFVQNRLLIENSDISTYPLRIRLRLAIERLWFRALRHRCSRYIVQTNSMKMSLQRKFLDRIPISLMSFMPVTGVDSSAQNQPQLKKYDFVYVASGEVHKNHSALLEAWRLLSNEGINPSLVLTIELGTYPVLFSEIARYQRSFDLNIVNLGKVPYREMSGVYKNSRALIFPSKLESLGLPLIEAAKAGLPIIASEKDYVRDVVQPVQTFDPDSAVSIARAVRRFLGIATPLASTCTAEQFLEAVFK